MTHHPTKHKHHRAGYTLVEASLAIAVLAVLSVGAMSLVQHNLQKNQHETTHERLTKINNALENFARRFGYLPCPAQPDLKAGNANYGTATSYNHDSKICDDANLVNEAGAVPVRSLHLDDDVAYDGWNNKFTYRISEYAGAKVDLEENTAFQSSIRISNLSGTPLTHGFDARHNGVLYVLISHGSKAKHATLNEGATTANSDNIVMDKMSARATIGNANHADALYYKGSGEGDFDDIVSYARYNDFFRPTQKLAPFAMPQEFCQNANMILKSGSPKDEGTPLHEFAENNAGMDAFTRNIYTAANRMKAICDASPTEVMAYEVVLPPTLYSWGDNAYTTLGTGADTTDVYDGPEALSGSDWDVVETGLYHVMALKENGTLWAWGQNYWGQLGTGDTDQQPLPTQVGSDNDWEKVSGYRAAVLAMKTDGSIYTWGYNHYGNLGQGDTNHRYEPTRLGIDNDWVDISIGEYDGLALKSDGTLWAWGLNNYGQVGINNTTQQLTPVPVGGQNNNWEVINAGNRFSFGIKTDGTLWGWGWGLEGQMGQGDNQPRHLPTQIGTDTDWKLVESSYHVLAIKEDGTLWAWGYNGQGGLGIGNTSNRNVPTRVGSDSDWAQISVKNSMSAALKTDGSLYNWGDNRWGQLGFDGSAPSIVTSPMQVGTATYWEQVSISSRGGLLLKQK